MEGAELCVLQLNNSCMRPKLSDSEYLLIYILLSCISLLTATLNLLVIISISHFKQLHTPTNLLLLSLAVSDFFVGLIIFFQIVLIDGCSYLSDVMCALCQYLTYIITSASVGTMVLISVDRYVAICDPLHYPIKITLKRIQICICLCWMCSVLCFSLLMKDHLRHPSRYRSCSGDCVISFNFIERIIDLILTFIIPSAVIFVLYMRIFIVAVSQARALQSHIATVTLQRSEPVTAKKSEMKAARTLGIVIVAFLICICPYFCVTLTGQDTFLSASSQAFVACLFYFNSCLNPVIYVFFYPSFRKSIKLTVTLQILQPDSCDTNMM
ncbi:trace amine-associated receptor 13c-like [Thunnus thynnus]|uniref:trace amine-associated receptor 13c-like n=1 Tax=Thunnus thynnus TaxID=8237 RepID=UPI003529A410